MGKKLVVVREDGSLCIHSVCKVVYLLILSALCIVAALAVNETIQKVLERYVKKDNILGYAIYALIAIVLVIVVAYIGCKWSPDIIEHMDLSPK